MDAEEITTEFYQEIYNSDGQLIEVHYKFPIDKGHQKIQQS